MSRLRARCLKSGHKFNGIEGLPLPYVFCSRWRCDATAVSVYAPANAAVSLHNAIPADRRFPPVELADDHSITQSWPQGAPSA